MPLNSLPSTGHWSSCNFVHLLNLVTDQGDTSALNAWLERPPRCLLSLGEVAATLLQLLARFALQEVTPLWAPRPDPLWSLPHCHPPRASVLVTSSSCSIMHHEHGLESIPHCSRGNTGWGLRASGQDFVLPEQYGTHQCVFLFKDTVFNMYCLFINTACALQPYHLCLN